MRVRSGGSLPVDDQRDGPDAGHLPELRLDGVRMLDSRPGEGKDDDVGIGADELGLDFVAISRKEPHRDDEGHDAEGDARDRERGNPGNQPGRAAAEIPDRELAREAHRAASIIPRNSAKSPRASWGPGAPSG